MALQPRALTVFHTTAAGSFIDVDRDVGEYICLGIAAPEMSTGRLTCKVAKGYKYESKLKRNPDEPRR